jgi:AraC-like DNA-binding protein
MAAYPPPFRAITELAQPVECFEAWVPHGVSPIVSRNFQAMLIREGSARLHGRFGAHTVTEGELVLLSAGVKCGSVSISPVDVVTAYVNPAFLVDQLNWTFPALAGDRRAVYREVSRAVPDVRSVRLDTQQYALLHEQFDKLASLSARGASPGERMIGGTELIWQISAIVPPAPPSWGVPRLQPFTGPLRPEVRTVLQLMHERYACDWTVPRLAREVALSESALRRAFTVATGLSPRKYLHHVRLAHFEEFVANHIMPISEAARMVGWSSTSHARSAFARSHGVSPREYRRSA